MPTPPAILWTRLLGTSERDSSNALTKGADGSIYVSGFTQGSLDGQTFSGGTGGDAFITKYNPDGSKAWTRLFGTSGDDRASALTTGLDGSIYVSGYIGQFTGGSLDGQTNSGGADAFITKYNPDGTRSWIRLLGTSGFDSASALTTGLDGSIYVCGNAQGSLDAQAYSGGGWDAFISKYNPDGTKAWTRMLGTSNNDGASALTTGQDGSIYVSGSVQGSLDGQTFNGGQDVFVTKFNPDGTKVWTRMLGTLGGACSLTTGLDGSIYISGNTTAGLWDGQTNSGYVDAFVTKYTTDGTKVWTRLLGTSGEDQALALTTGLDGFIYVSGLTQGSLDGQTFSGVSDAYVSKYDPYGNKVWTRALGTSGEDSAKALITGLDGSIYISGYTGGSLNGGAYSSGIWDAFIVKLATPDTTAPTIAINSNKAALKAGETAQIYFTLSEIAMDFVLSDISVSGGTLSNFSGSGLNYAVTFTPYTSSTTPGSVSVANAKFSDEAGNYNADEADANNLISFVRLQMV
jgi:hypothetical protein